jgi:hypothetical protein
MTRQQSKQLGENIGIFFMCMGGALLIRPSFMLMSWVAIQIFGGVQ